MDKNLSFCAITGTLHSADSKDYIDNFSKKYNVLIVDRMEDFQENKRVVNNDAIQKLLDKKQQGTFKVNMA